MTDEKNNSNRATNDIVIPQVVSENDKQSLQSQQSTEQIIEAPEENEQEEKVVIPRLTPKLNRLAELFLDKSNKKTYGNLTESAMIAYNCKSRVTAAIIGSQCYRKLRILGTIYAEQEKNFTLSSFIDIAVDKARTSEKPEWWDRAGDLLGFRDIKPSTLVQNNTQNNLHLDGTQVKDFNAEFKAFLKSKAPK